jgi:hypothetical protein
MRDFAPDPVCLQGARRAARMRLRRLVSSQPLQAGSVMTTAVLILIPAAMVFGFLGWVFVLGADAQKKSDEYMEQWVNENHAEARSAE